MENRSKRQFKRQQEREIINEYHKFVTEEALEPLYQSFLEWKNGRLPYDELTERIHLFHKRNQEIYKEFNDTEWDILVLYAKFKLGRLDETDKKANRALLERWGYEDRDV
jgi:hypothetical protein